MRRSADTVDTASNRPHNPIHSSVKLSLTFQLQPGRICPGCSRCFRAVAKCRRNAEVLSTNAVQLMLDGNSSAIDLINALVDAGQYLVPLDCGAVLDIRNDYGGVAHV